MGTEGSTAVTEPLGKGSSPLNAPAMSASASCALPARYEAVSSAREFTRRTMWRWEMGGRFDTVALVVSELVTNALRHGLRPGRTVDGLGLEPPVRLHLMHWSANLVCAVRDPSDEAPRTAPCTVDETCVEDLDALLEGAAESGRGLRLVDSFSDCWGWHPATGGKPGKVVWAMFRLDSV